ncbi:MAG: chorismate mutase [Candidatus Izimaplasma sp.]|nr:chorismate mutase [Candidatus Izimaplasma bacterium]
MEKLRKEIDNIDQELKELFLKRMRIVKEIAEYKKTHQLKVENVQREKKIIQRLNTDEKYLRDLFPKFMTSLFEVSKIYQELLMKEEK